MPRIPGMTLIKDQAGKVTHVTLSMKHHSVILDVLIEEDEIAKARIQDAIPWDIVKTELLKIVGDRKNS